MGELEQLERLQRLRESGALTDDEFQRQKAKVLSGEATPAKARAWMLAVLVLVSIALVTLFLMFSPSAEAEPDQLPTKMLSQSAEAEPDQPAEANLANAVAGDRAAADALSASAKRADYAWATSPSVIGMNPAFLESKLGPAPEKTADQMFYEVDGCRVWYTVNKTEITSFLTNITEKCEPSIGGRKLAFGTTMKQVGGGALYADCLEYCGNAYDPQIHLLQQGGRVSGYIDTMFSSHDYERDPRDAWAQSVRRARGLGDTDVAEDADIFRCVTNAPNHAEQAILNARVTLVQVGRDIAPC